MIAKKLRDKLTIAGLRIVLSDLNKQSREIRQVIAAMRFNGAVRRRTAARIAGEDKTRQTAAKKRKPIKVSTEKKADWKSTPAGKRKMAAAQRKAWKKRRAKAADYAARMETRRRNKAAAHAAQTEPEFSQGIDAPETTEQSSESER